MQQTKYLFIIEVCCCAKTFTPRIIDSLLKVAKICSSYSRRIIFISFPIFIKTRMPTAIPSGTAPFVLIP